ncbi:F0F1 ATP synthase subunit A [Thiothrix unzii]|uniref:ATP synthase subunit a n=1 Tax=Thiothrix unzii TaxID=111769 RepID=A0A975F8E5_9GAMM|nr:F0F1 ATP synthase subunit A [Thiothrix unzii]QTR52963.1 F0F1 ATP synthase subunit A [Thiothrix unzii]
MHLSSDDLVFWEYGWVKLNLTIITTWILMVALGGGCFLLTRRLSSAIHIPRWQHVLEVVLLGIQAQIEEVGLAQSRRYISFIGTLFLFVVVANLAAIIPGYEPPTGSLSTSTALAICVFIAVPLFGIREIGVRGYLKSYLHPTPVMLPFNIISEISRTLALAIRLFGNIMSGGMIIAILLTITPFFFPVVMHALHLLTGLVQAYIFSILATVYIAAATRGEGA